MAQIKTLRETKTADRLIAAGADALQNAYEVQFLGFPTVSGELLSVRALNFTIPSRTLNSYDVPYGFETYKFKGGKNQEERILSIRFRGDVKWILKDAFSKAFESSLYRAGQPLFGLSPDVFHIRCNFLEVPQDTALLGYEFLYCDLLQDPEVAFSEDNGDGLQFEVQFIYTKRQAIKNS